MRQMPRSFSRFRWWDLAADNVLLFLESSMGRKKPEFVMLQWNAAVSFVAQGMTMDDDTGPITSEADQHQNRSESDQYVK
jgi:hypothetical protein